jgi:hypothetical protein
MVKIYVVLSSDKELIGIFDTKKKAMRYADEDSIIFPVNEEQLEELKKQYNDDSESKSSESESD